MPLNGLSARAMDAHLDLAAGDALGATVEFMTPAEIRKRHGNHRNVRGGGWLRLRKGQITDDAEMSLALGQTILVEGRVAARAVAEVFSAWMRIKPVDFGHTVLRGIARYHQTGGLHAPPPGGLVHTGVSPGGSPRPMSPSRVSHTAAPFGMPEP